MLVFMQPSPGDPLGGNRGERSGESVACVGYLLLAELPLHHGLRELWVGLPAVTHAAGRSQQVCHHQGGPQAPGEMLLEAADSLFVWRMAPGLRWPSSPLGCLRLGPL